MFPRARFSDSEIDGSTPAGGSPSLIATNYVLHRLLAPRHPLDALLRLIKTCLSEYPASSKKEDQQEIPKTPQYQRTIGNRPMPPAANFLYGGGERDRTDDLRLAKPALSQLSYTPVYNRLFHFMVGLDRFELSTSRLSGVRSNQLSYRPIKTGSDSPPQERLKTPEQRRHAAPSILYFNKGARVRQGRRGIDLGCPASRTIRPGKTMDSLERR